MSNFSLPQADEYAEFYAGYIQRVPETDVVGAMESQLTEVQATLNKFSDAEAESLKGTEQWSLKQVLGHLCDSDRVLSYRLLRISRGDRTPLPGYEQDDYVAEGRFNERTLESLLEEYTLLRKATIALAKTITPEMAPRRGVANGSEVTVRALLYIIVGHTRQHLEFIRMRNAGKLS
ncbi:MAG TPA: DinB family protein [Clostridia bacterium]|nr:DinB family protein [Clostridia bacterium]